LSAAYDLVVIGGGIAGLTAAGRAAQAGLRVAVLERGTDEAYPCNSRYSGGILHIAFHNIREPASALLEVIDAATRGKAEPKLAKAFADNAARVVDWLRDEGVEFMSVGNIAYQQWVLAPRRPLTPGLDWKGRGADVSDAPARNQYQKARRRSFSRYRGKRTYREKGTRCRGRGYARGVGDTFRRARSPDRGWRLPEQSRSSAREHLGAGFKAHAARRGQRRRRRT